ncbi:hypothetical protein [Candidatus Manganitrophus noduliformans]|uniref:Uncharacterized protein n=1 Tax=Candidatus Manganitrophus noduliformans TaxID=2606439 RepID=A0A7X6IBF9_9BACT|nr:hypothetical protein [Candidatus Manganitrophus noduliformans]NKE71588.1 hypothetical protein [Candidatus Manganitrophus noduliformans]
MATMKQVGNLEIDEDLPFQERSWKIQRIGWILMALAVLGALLGLFGPGPLSSAGQGRQGGPLRLEYKRFERFQSPTTLRVLVGPGAEKEGAVRLWIDLDYLKGVQIRRITPEPDETQSGPDRLTYLFRVEKSGPPKEITFHLETEQFGLLPGRIGLNTGEELAFRQWIYP